MSHLQLVVEDGNTTRKRVAAVPNPAQVPAEDFDDQSRHALMFGSDDLIQVAARLVISGYKVIDISFLDSRFRVLNESATQDALHVLIRALNAKNVQDLGRVIQQSLHNLYVNQVELRHRQNGTVVTLAQDGVLIAADRSGESVAQAINGFIDEIGNFA